MLHLQYNTPGWDQAVPTNPAVKMAVLGIKRPDMCKTAKQINPSCITMVRHVDDGLQHFSSTWEGARELARRWWSLFIDQTFREQYAPWIDLVKGYNETLANSQNEEERRQRIMMEQALAIVWNDEYRVQSDFAHIRPVLASAAVGNDIPEVMAEICNDEDAVLSYHAYSKYKNGKRDPEDWRYHSGRWAYMEAGWDAKPQWLFTEAGPYESATHGWRSHKVLGGNREAYVEAVRAWIRDVKTTEAWREGRVLGFGLFTTDKSKDDDQFGTYRTVQPELNLLRDMYVQEWTTIEPPTPEPPTPQPMPGQVRVVDGIGHLNLRSRPGVIAPETDIGDLHPGKGPLDVVARQDDWYKVAGWAHKDWLAEVE